MAGLSPAFFRPAEDLVENDRLANGFGIREKVGHARGKRGGYLQISGLGGFRRLDSHRRRRRFAGQRGQLAHLVIEHLAQTLVDLLVGLGDFFAELAFAATKILGVEVFFDMLLDLPADRRGGDNFRLDRLLDFLDLPRRLLRLSGARRPRLARSGRLSSRNLRSRSRRLREQDACPAADEDRRLPAA